MTVKIIIVLIYYKITIITLPVQLCQKAKTVSGFAHLIDCKLKLK